MKHLALVLIGHTMNLELIWLILLNSVTEVLFIMYVLLNMLMKYVFLTRKLWIYFARCTNYSELSGDHGWNSGYDC